MVYIDSHPQQLNLTEALAAVSTERRTYALRFQRIEDQRLCLSAYLLLQLALREEYGLSEVPPFIDDLPAVLTTLELSGKGQDISFQTTCHNRYVYTVCRGKEQEQGSRSKSKN